MATTRHAAAVVCSTQLYSLLCCCHRSCCSYFLRDGVKEPLAIGDVLLEDNSTVKGFVGEAYAVAAATEITQYGGWRAYLAAKHQQ